MDFIVFILCAASKVDPMHLEYFTFSGRVMALALMHKVQVGIVFDRAFFLQLAGMHITLEDIRDADPCLYSSCKQILQMDPEFIDSDALSLTFVQEVEELGSRKVVELCSGGKSIVVNSKNREKYVDLLIQHRFVTSISEPVSRFACGFADILSNSGQPKLFFQSLELEDLDWMLYGSENAICVEDWKAHTEYNGYKETDPQISWFWKVCSCILMFLSYLNYKVAFFYHVLCSFFPYIWIS
jgi:E3 ubiquitin-protein ligase NEDD4